MTRKFYPFLGWLTLLIGLSCLAGGFGLVFQDGLGMPLSYLDSSPFKSFLWPGLILFFVVGGTQLFAAWQLFKKKNAALYAAAVAGFGLLLWIFIESYIVPDPHWLQLLYFALGLLILIFAILGALKGEKFNQNQ